MSHGPGLGNFGRSWAHSFSEQSYWWNLSWKTRANSCAFLVSLPANEAMHVPSPSVWCVCTPLDKSWAHSFSAQSHWWNLSWKPVPTALDSHYIAPSQQSSPRAISHGMSRALPTELSPSAISHSFLSVLDVHASVSLLSNGVVPRLFPKVSVHHVHASVSPPPNAAFPRFLIRKRCPRFRLASSSLPTELSPSYFPPFPVRPPYRRFRVAPSQRNSPQAISHSFPSVHPIVASVSLPHNGTLPKLFPTVSRPSTLSSLPCRSLPKELSPSYFFPSVHPVVASVSLPPDEALPELFPTDSGPSTLSSLKCRSPRGKVN